MAPWIDASAYWGAWSVRTPGVDDVHAFLAKMDALEIEVAAITGLRALADNTRLGNREVADVVRRAPDRFVGVACINPGSGRWVVSTHVNRRDALWSVVREGLPELQEEGLL